MASSNTSQASRVETARTGSATLVQGGAVSIGRDAVRGGLLAAGYSWLQTLVAGLWDAHLHRPASDLGKKRDRATRDRGDADGHRGSVLREGLS